MNNNLLFSHRNQEPESSILYIVGTPIGNLEDISSRALQILKKVSLIACEDTRQTKKIMTRFGINNKLISFNKDNSFKKIPKIISYLKQGKSIALVSDAGMPSICDPGEDLVRDTKLNNLEVICIPGPCAALTALVSSGLPSSRFIFEGFIPKKKNEREKILMEISESEKTIILYESPHRIKQLLLDLKKFCGGEREIHVSRELTKKFEEHIFSNINTLIKIFDEKKFLGELTLVIKGNKNTNKTVIEENLLKKELQELTNAGLSLSSASRYLAKKKNLKKSIIYNLY